MKYEFQIKEVSRSYATDFIQSLHYSKIMPKLTKHFLGCYLENELVGVLTLGWGTQPKATIAKLFDGLDTKNYYEIGKMCMHPDMPRNSESQMLSSVIKWMKINLPDKKYFCCGEVDESKYPRKTVSLYMGRWYNGKAWLCVSGCKLFIWWIYLDTDLH